MQIHVNKHCANIIGNTLRQIALTQLSVLRPIAIKVGETCNVLTAGKDVQEDMTTIISNLTALSFKTTSTKSIIRVDVSTNSVLRASDLENGEIIICNDEGDKVILTTMGVPVNVTIYFRVGTGVSTHQDNTFYLERYGASTKDLVVFVSRHSQISNFAYKVIPQSGEKDILDISILSNTNKSEEQIINEVKSELLSIIQSI